MANWTLNAKFTGATTPVTAGYYGPHDGSANVIKKAGAEMYAWKSDDFANAYFLGATVDPDAFKTVTISGTDSAFDGDYIYDATVSKWLKGTTHSLFKDGVTWKLTDGTKIYTAPDNGLDTPPTTFERIA